MGFTLTAYANCRAAWAHAPQALLYTKDVRLSLFPAAADTLLTCRGALQVDGAFTQKTAGGNHTHPTYYLNPQYHLHVHPRPLSRGAGAAAASRDAKATLALAVSTDRHVPMNLMLAWSQGGRINECVVASYCCFARRR